MMLRYAAQINKIIGFSAVDGPGNRTAIFTQGCNQNCLYCHNPETINLCENCGSCVKTCPTFSLSQGPDGIIWNRSLCCECDNCIQTCIHNSTPRTRLMTAAEVMSEICKYFPFISGITVSGGECTLWPEFLTQLFSMVKGHGKTTFIDSNGLIDFSAMSQLLDVTDMVMLDLKAANSSAYKALTGKDNTQVLNNISYLASIGKLYEIRTVVVPDILDNHAIIEVGSALIAKYPSVRYKIIRYRPLGVRENAAEAPSDDLMDELAALALAKGVKEVVII